ncbi:uncharacterized protein LOC129293002 [Prosopis cineraria]|uniref:uncharacterized protein LOC129293002 n=1 Tax=Prosopis cineraria TaxID=364024 RepID=UPI002410AFF4|nr:uncharacterized protein LOC129293002 [Prosopis cineraria]
MGFFFLFLSVATVKFLSYVFNLLCFLLLDSGCCSVLVKYVHALLMVGRNQVVGIGSAGHELKLTLILVFFFSFEQCFVFLYSLHQLENSIFSPCSAVGSVFFVTFAVIVVSDWLADADFINDLKKGN